MLLKHDLNLEVDFKEEKGLNIINHVLNDNISLWVDKTGDKDNDIIKDNEKVKKDWLEIIKSKRNVFIIYCMEWYRFLRWNLILKF